MSERLARGILFSVLVSIALLAQQPKPSGIVGVWRVVDYTTGGRTNHPKPGYWIFTGKHFSMVMETRDDVQRHDVDDLEKATAKELLAS